MTTPVVGVRQYHEFKRVMLNVVSVNTQQSEEKEEFWSRWIKWYRVSPVGERVLIGANFNGHVGERHRIIEVLRRCWIFMMLMREKRKDKWWRSL